jgi:hypothetical protein
MKTIMCLIVLIYACGRVPTSSSSLQTDPTSPTSSQANKTPSSAHSDPCTYYDNCLIQGSISGAFPLTVDSVHYSDIEAFYTAELPKLEKQAADQGYKDVSFEGQLGLDDLKYGLDVYAQSVSGEGFSGQTEVEQNGQFVLYDTYASDNTDNMFNIRLNKRVTLTTPSIQFCWNFSGTAQNVGMNSPKIIDTFSTTLTLYACNGVAQGMTIPVAVH